MSLIQNSAFYNSDSENIQRIQTENDEVLIPTEREERRCKVTRWILISILVLFISIEAVVGFSYYLSRSNQNPIDELMKSTAALKSEYETYM